MAAKVVDDIKVAGAGDNAKCLLVVFNETFKIGKLTTGPGPGRMRFFGINIHQDVDMTIKTDAEDKINLLTECYLSRPSRKQSYDPVNKMEKSQFDSTNSSLGWIGPSAYPLCSFYASYLQQKSPEYGTPRIFILLNIISFLTVLYPVLNLAKNIVPIFVENFLHCN